jgi:hypothetical protein
VHLAKKATASTGLIMDLKARCAGAKNSQEKAAKENEDVVIKMQTLEAPQSMMSNMASDANLKAKRMSEKWTTWRCKWEGAKSTQALLGWMLARRDKRWQCKPALIPSVPKCRAM